MARKNAREKRKCQNKKVFSTKKDAGIAVSSLYQKNGNILHPYMCPFCKKWHVGHTPGGRKLEAITKLIKG